MIIGYAILLDDNCHNFIRQIQLELHQHIGIGLARQSPHITIKSPFETNDIQKHIDYLEKLSKEIRPFEITFAGFGSFEKKVIFLDVLENIDLTRLHHRILRDVKTRFDLEPHKLEGKNVRFHASIAGFSQEEQFLESKLYCNRYKPDFRFRITTLGLFCYLGEKQGWIINRRISIKL